MLLTLCVHCLAKRHVEEEFLVARKPLMYLLESSLSEVVVDIVRFIMQVCKCL